MSRLAIFAALTAAGCGGGPEPEQTTLLATNVPWTQLRYTQTFNAGASCWRIFGGQATGNLQPFNASAGDVVVSPYRMGGGTVNAYDGTTSRCDNSATNFWHALSCCGHYATVVQRRASSAPAGLATHAGCVDINISGRGTTSWQYYDIYVR